MYKKEIRVIDKTVYIIENFISESTSDFLSKVFDNELTTLPTNQYIKMGPSSGPINPINFIDNYKLDKDYNIGLDLLNNISVSIAKTLSLTYNKDFSIKTTFYSAMYENGNNDLHMDNYYISLDNKLKRRLTQGADWSALLYFNENYDGGNITFPYQNLKLKPKKGTLIFFEGNENVPHEVLKVTGGERKNLICFLTLTKDLDKKIQKPESEPEVKLTMKMLEDEDFMNNLLLSYELD